MPQQVKSTESMLTTLTWLVCASCRGKEEVGILLPEAVFAVDHYEPCSSCQDSSGAATGLMLPGLSEDAKDCECVWSIRTRKDMVGAYREPCDECEAYSSDTTTVIKGWERAIALHSPQCTVCDCKGRNRIPRRHDVLENVLEALLKEVKCGVDIQPLVDGGYGVSLSVGGSLYATGSTMKEAIINALSRELVAKGMIED